MPEEEAKNNSSFTILDPKRTTAKDIIAVWRAALQEAADKEAAGKKV
jgi:hypothetical protein